MSDFTADVVNGPTEEEHAAAAAAAAQAAADRAEVQVGHTLGFRV